MKSAAISKSAFPEKAHAENAARHRAELNAKILKLLSKPMVSGERAMLSSILADPAALSRLVRHAGLSMALNKALEIEGAHSKHISSKHSALLPLELTQLLMKAKPLAFGSGELYGANLELSDSQPHGRLPVIADPKIAAHINQFGFGIATPYAPESSDSSYTIDYLVDENREEFNTSTFNTNRNGNASQPSMNPATQSVLFAVGFAFLLVLGLNYAFF